MSKLRPSLVTFLDQLGEASGCHRIPERSFFWKGHQFPVCARCTGVMIGQVLSILVNLFVGISFKLSFLFLSIMGFDWLLQETGCKMSTNFRRLTTGILGGFGLFSLYCNFIKKFIKLITKVKEYPYK